MFLTFVGSDSTNRVIPIHDVQEIFMYSDCIKISFLSEREPLTVTFESMGDYRQWRQRFEKLTPIGYGPTEM